MGQKVNPIGMRIGVSKDWNSRWYANKHDFASLLNEDVQIRKYLTKELKGALLSHVEIERVKDVVTVSIFTARPGVVIGQENERIKTLTKKVTKLANGKKVKISVVEVKNPSLDANIVAQDMAKQLEECSKESNSKSYESRSSWC